MRASWIALLLAACAGCEEAVVLGDGRSRLGEPDVPRFSEPVLIEALVGDEDEGDDDPSLNDARTWICFNSKRAGGAGDEDIWCSRRASASNPWGAPEPATALNSEARETGLALSEDGLTIYWSSDRDGGAGGLDIYMSQRASLEDPWSEPVAVSALNGSGDDLISAVQDEGRLALLARRDGDTGYRLWWARRDSPSEPWLAPEPIDDVSRDNGDTDPFLVLGGTRLLFSREGDLYVVQRAGEGAPFGEPAPLATLNSDGEDTDPWSDRDLTFVVFASDRSGESRLYEAVRAPAP